MGQYKFLSGSYTNDKFQNGISIFQFDSDKTNIRLVSSVQVENPSFLAFYAKHNYLYSVNENHTSDDCVSAFVVNSDNQLILINSISIGGSDPCYIAVDSKREHLVCANYSDGSLSVVSLDPNGALSKIIQRISHPVSADNVAKEQSQMHSTVFSPCEKFLIATNLGLDTITIYPYSREYKEWPLDVQNLNKIQMVEGAGPRHLIFSANAKFIYVVGELDASIHVFEWQDGVMIPLQSEFLMLPNFIGKNSAADLHLSRSGDFLYVSNRGDANEIISFAVNQLTGKLSRIGGMSVEGIGPRNFAISTDGSLLAVANQTTNEIVFFDLDQDTGELSSTGFSVSVESPVFVEFI